MGTQATYHLWTGLDQSRRAGLSLSFKVVVGLSIGLVLIAVLAWSFQHWWGAAPTPDYRGTGVVVALLPPPSNLHATRPVIIIYHDPVPGLMKEAMSMPFIAASTKLFGGLSRHSLKYGSVFFLPISTCSATLLSEEEGSSCREKAHIESLSPGPNGRSWRVGPGNIRCHIMQSSEPG